MNSDPIYHIIENHIDPRMEPQFMWAIAEYLNRQNHVHQTTDV